MSYVHLHLHTEYSMLDGANKLKSLAKAIKAKGMSAVGISDHGNMFGAIDFYKTMRAEGLKPIIGIESYIHNYDHLGTKEPVAAPFKQRFHLCLFAKNQTGYNNLMRLSSESFLRGFYYYPRINKRLLEEFHEGIVCTSACLAGEINFHLNQADKRHTDQRKGYDHALAIAADYKRIFGEDFYLELMRHGIEEQRLIDNQIIRIAKELNIKLIATNDAHYTEQINAEAQEAYVCIASGKTLNDPKRLRHTVKEFYVKSPEEMAALFADIPEALENTLEIAEKCNLELRLGNPTPPNYKFTHTVAGARGVALEEESDYSHANDAILFETLCREKLENRLRYVPAENHETYRARLDREIAVIKQMKFAGYMLIVWDFVNKAKELKIPVGPGRGSAAGSLVAFALEITNIDPMKYGLLFERFLNPERISMPDIDMDFCQARRGEVIDYVVSQYGRENVAQVITFNSLLAKGVIRDTARILDIAIPEADRMAKLIPKELQITLEKAIAAEPKLRELVESDANAAEIWRLALQLEGLKRQAGVHAAGLVISNEPLWHKTPLYRPSGTEDVVTQYDGHYLEDVDLIKFDFLGLQTLSVIDHALGLIAKTHEPIDLDIMETNDSGVFELISTGNTLGIFQIESEGLRNLSRRLKPTCFEDIIAMIALYRPGPLESGMVDDFVDRKHGRAATTYMFPALEPILAPTYGVIVYQEQVMQIVQTIGGFSLGKADLVRRAMGKKDDDLMNKMRMEFAEGAEKQGYDNHKAQELFELIRKFAGYGFNKSHSAAYAMLTYQTAYLKCYYPAEFMSAMLTFDSAHSDKVATYIQEAKRMGIDILPPDINRSQIDFEPLHDGEASKVIFGMGAIKGVGSIALEIIIKARQEQGGRFATIIDFLSQVDSQKVNKKVFEALIKAGALDGFGFSRRAMLGAIDKIVTTAQNANNIRKEVRGGLFDDEAETMASAVMIDIPNLPELDDKVILEFEKESLGLYVSGHPLDEYRDELSKYTYALSASIEEIEDGSEVVFIGKVENVENKISKKGARFGVVHLIDLTGSPELMIFERDMEKLDKLWKEDSARPIAFRVNVDKNGDRVGLRVRRVLALEELANDKPQPPRRNNFNNYNREKPKESEAVKQPPLPMTLEIAGGSNPQVIEELYRIIKANPGVKPVMVRILTENSEIEMVTRLSASELVRDEVVKIGVKYKG